MLSVQGNANLPWTDREPKAFFRGRDSSRARLKLVRLAREHPDLIEAGITRFFFFRDEEAVLGTVPHASFFDFFKVTLLSVPISSFPQLYEYVQYRPLKKNL